MKKSFYFILIFLIFSTLTKSYSQEITTDKEVSTYCFGDSVIFTNTSSVNFVASHWRFGDGKDTWRENPVHIYQETNSFEVWLILTFSDASKDSTSIVITINTTPSVTLINDVFFQSLTASTAETDNEFLWYINSEVTSETDSLIYYLESGTYSVIASNPYNCSDSVSVNIDLNDSPIPEDSLNIVVKNNILTPDNADGANDILFISGLVSYQSAVFVAIFNKWGQKVYENNDYTNLGGFEGKNNSGQALDAGTYYYIIKTVGRKTATGYVDLIR